MKHNQFGPQNVEELSETIIMLCMKSKVDNFVLYSTCTIKHGNSKDQPEKVDVF